MLRLIALLLPSIAAALNLNVAKAAAHAELVELVRGRLVDGPRQLPAGAVHVEAALHMLPPAYGLPTTPPLGLLSPDVVALDATNNELLIIECTICPDPALSRYVHRKTDKYRTPAKMVGAAPPLVVALGTGGTVPESTKAALAMLDGTDVPSEDLLERCISIARRRPDAPKARRGRRRS